jgi:hypothetical protein
MTKKIQKIMFLCAAIMWHTFMLPAQNENPVGAIPGVIDVSPMGAATYTIPIEVVPGTQGIQPNLSIVYNSFGGMGLLGMKWNLAGISAITRCGQNRYNDSDVTAVGFSQKDRFAIDGNRLVGVDNAGYGTVGKVYATEMENFTRIVSYGGTNGHPEYFIAYTDNGSIIEYGNSRDSRQMMDYNNSKVLSWRINKITDANGNYMTFNYFTSANDVYVYKIEYTGNENNNMLPYAKVEFSYSPMSDVLGKNTRFLAGYAIMQEQLLRSITVIYGNDIVRKYRFSYGTNIQEERTTHLKEIVLSDGNETNETKLNATVITWRDQKSVVGSVSGVLGNVPDGFVLPGDFNGDGYTDFIRWGATTTQDKWHLYIGDEHTPPSPQYPLGGGFVDTGGWHTHKALGDGRGAIFYKADVDGCGADELIIAQRMDSDLSQYEITIESLRPGSLSSTFARKEMINFHQIYFGDFDGDGKTDILFEKKDNNDKSSFELYRWATNSYSEYPGLPANSVCKVRVGDFTNSGKTDVELTFNYEKDNVVRYYFNSNTFTAATLKQTASFGAERYSGDFNGDGISDLLTYNGSSWSISFGQGDGSYTSTIGISDLTPDPVIIADFDGDGKDDIFQPNSSQYGSAGARILFSKGYIGGQYKYELCKIGHLTGYTNMSIGDMNHDGSLDIILSNSTQNSPPNCLLCKHAQTT